MVDNYEPPKKTPDEPQEEKQFTPYVSHRLRAKMEDRDEDDEKAGPGAAIAVIGLLAVILVCGGLFLLNQKNAKKTAPGGQTAEASQTPEQNGAAASDSAAAADSVARLAAADSMARATTEQVSGNTPQPAKQAPAASKSAATAKTPAGGATAGGATAGGAMASTAPAAAPATPAKYGIAVGTFLFDDKAAAEKDRLATATSLTATVVPKDDGGTTTYQVVLGPFDSRAAAEAKGNELLAAGTVKESQVIKMKK